MNELERLIEQLVQGPVLLRAQAVRGLVLLGDEALEATAALALEVGQDAVVRSFAASALAQMGAQDEALRARCLGVLTKLLGDVEVTVVRTSVGSLGSLGDPRAIPALEKLLTDGRKDPKAWFSGEETISGAVEDALAQLRMVELKVVLAQNLRHKRQERNLTQEQVALRLGSSQSRVAKMEASDPSVSMDLLVRTLLALGTTRKELAGMFTICIKE